MTGRYHRSSFCLTVSSLVHLSTSRASCRSSLGPLSTFSPLVSLSDRHERMTDEVTGSDESGSVPFHSHSSVSRPKGSFPSRKEWRRTGRTLRVRAKTRRAEAGTDERE